MTQKILICAVLGYCGVAAGGLLFTRGLWWLAGAPWTEFGAGTAAMLWLVVGTIGVPAGVMLAEDR